MKMLEIQTERHLSEEEVRQINFIIKSRASRFIAAANEEWLYPEQYVTKSDWARYGHGYLLMPDPRSVCFTQEVLIGFKGGKSTGFDAYGRRPGDPHYRSEDRESERRTFERFQGEFARLCGPFRRGRNYEFGELSPERDDDDYHMWMMSLEHLHRRKKPRD